MNLKQDNILMYLKQPGINVPFINFSYHYACAVSISSKRLSGDAITLIYARHRGGDYKYF
jgi:hypothetical protein